MNKEVALGIVQALDAEFALPVHIDTVKQELNPPCFLVTRIEGELKQELCSKYCSRYKSSHYFDIIYFTDNEQTFMEHLELEERLYNCLEWIKVGDGCEKALSMKGSVIDGELHFMVNYGFHVLKKEQPAEKMQNMTITTELGGESDE